jgi:hypothetical protein
MAGSPLPTSGLTHRDVAGLRDRARDVICSAADQVDQAEQQHNGDRAGRWGP